MRRYAPALVILLVVILAGLSIASGLVVARHFRSDASAVSRLFAGVFAGLNTSRPGGEADALLRLGEQVRAQGIPLVVTDGTGRVTAVANLPFEAALDDPRIPVYARQLDHDNPPISDEVVGTIHYGPLPAKRQLIMLTVLQALTVILMLSVGLVAYRNALAAQRDRLWVAMAREAAHQMGTPLTSLQGWIEAVRSRPTPPPGLADHLLADAERLERVAQRFERIGHAGRQDLIGLGALADRVAGYFRPRLPKHANPITLVVRSAGPGPMVLGDPILLEWALESLVKNAIDALRGQSGTIQLITAMEPPWATLRVQDDGPGVSREIRRTLFDPGITTKSGGWGVGLALARRVVEDGHNGELVLETTETGASFLIRIPKHEQS
ncbi:MAG: HAMP domain-containing sensor histidine kinase [Gemmatimonadota bacterium]